MTREWKQGDVAMIKAHLGDQETRVVRGFDDRWHGPAGIYRLFSDARPLVVIDPADREQVERLESLYLREDHNDCIDTVECMQDALYALADPKPPRPDEPLGLGAVVEDEAGRKWIRTEWKHPWTVTYDEESGESLNYADIAVVRVLSEGVAQ